MSREAQYIAANRAAPLWNYDRQCHDSLETELVDLPRFCTISKRVQQIQGKNIVYEVKRSESSCTSRYMNCPHYVCLFEPLAEDGAYTQFWCSCGLAVRVGHPCCHYFAVSTLEPATPKAAYTDATKLAKVVPHMQSEHTTEPSEYQPAESSKAYHLQLVWELVWMMVGPPQPSQPYCECVHANAHYTQPAAHSGPQEPDSRWLAHMKAQGQHSALPSTADRYPYPDPYLFPL